MNQQCAPSRGGCGTWFTVGAEICPHCQKAAGDIGELNVGAHPAVAEDVSDLVSVAAAQRSRKSATNKPNTEEDTDK